MDDTGKSAWCRSNGAYLQDLRAWRQSATQALANPEELRASPHQTKQDRRRVRELKRDLQHKNVAMAETAALLVLSKNRGNLQQGRG